MWRVLACRNNFPDMPGGGTWQVEWMHRLTALRPHGQPRVAVLLEALDHGQSSGFLTRPAATGFCSIYLVTRLYSAPFRIQWSNDSSCQKCLPVRPSN